MTSQQAAALAELQEKSLEQIQRETAYTWAYRAWAAKRLRRMPEFVDLRHEALEHAALTDDDTVLDDVRRIMSAI